MGDGAGFGKETFKLPTSSKRKTWVAKNEAEMLETEENETVLPDLGIAGMPDRCSRRGSRFPCEVIRINF